MSIITFWSEGKEETAKTLSLTAIATYMAIEHNCRILVLSTNFNDTTLESCFWETGKIQEEKMAGLSNGIEGLAKAIMSNKTSPEVITNYTKIVFKNRLEVLPGIRSENYDEYQRLKGVYPEIIKAASRYYDLVFIDAKKGKDDSLTQDILNISDLVVVNITQRLKLIDGYIQLKQEDILFKKPNTILLVGRYDRYSKYNSKNIARYIGEKEVYTVPYSTLFFEAANEGKVADFFLRFRKIDENDRNAVFINEIRKAASKILYKLQELRFKM